MDNSHINKGIFYNEQLKIKSKYRSHNNSILHSYNDKFENQTNK